MLTCQVIGSEVKIVFTSFWEESKASPDTGSQPPHMPYQPANMRPLYLKMQNGVQDITFANPYHQEHAFPKLSSTHSANNHVSRRIYSDGLNQTWPNSQGKLSSRKLAILEPLDSQYQYGLFKVYENEPAAPTHPHVSINPSNLPSLDWRPQSRWVHDDQYDLQKVQEGHRTSRWSRRTADDSHRMRTVVDRENGLKPVLVRQTKYPSAHTNGHGHTSPLPPSSPQPTRFVSPIPSPLAPLAPPSPTPLNSNTLPPAPSSQALHVEDLSGDNASEELTNRSRPPSEAKEAEDQIDRVDTLIVEEERLNTAPAAPLSGRPPTMETEPDTTQSEELLPDEKTPLNSRKFSRNSGKPRLKTRGAAKEEKALSPELVPFDRPKEALVRCLHQLEQPDWEVTIKGLQAVVQLAEHHSVVLSQSLHQVVVAVTKHVKNLRSQVARVACRAATHLFTCMGRGVENLRDMEELCAVLLNRTADTNKFLRADCNSALDAMVDNVSCSKIVSSTVNKGAKHQNAVVRGTTCRLLLRLCQRIGPERALSLPRETRDAILNTGARSLTEGSLDTRRYAKEMFVLLSQDPRLPGLLKEVIPSSVMRSISKVLARLTAQ